MRARRDTTQTASDRGGDPATRDISVVCPLRDEQESLGALHGALTAVLACVEVSYELIFVDDGSRDESLAHLHRLATRDPRMRVIVLGGRYGKATALARGFLAARGKIIVTLDADLQDDPREIPNLLCRVEHGYDMVVGWRKCRQDPRSKIATSRIFNFVVSRTTGVALHDFNCGLKAFRREAVAGMQLRPLLDPYIAVMAFWRGFRVTEVVVRHHPRRYGRSKFGRGRLLAGLNGYLLLLCLRTSRCGRSRGKEARDGG